MTLCTFEIIILLSKQPHACKTHIFYWSRKNTAENSRDRRKSNRSMKSSLQTLRCSSRAIKWNQCHWWLVTWVLSETWQSHWKASNSSHPKSGRRSCAPCRQGYSIRVQEFWSGTSQDEPCTLDKTVSSAGVSSPPKHWEVKAICLAGITHEVRPTKATPVVVSDGCSQTGVHWGTES